MTEMTTSLGGSIGSGEDTSAARLDRLFDRIESGETSLTNDGSFEDVLLEELRRSNDTPASVIPDASQAVQNGNFYTVAGDQSSLGTDIRDSDFLDRAAYRFDIEHHPQRVIFDADAFGSLHADVRDQEGQSRPPFDGLERHWTGDDVGVQSDRLIERLDEDAPAFDLPRDHVFFNGDGRPILLSSVTDDASFSLADDSNQIILPDGAVFDYQPWQTSADATHDRWTEAQGSFEPLSLTTRILIENNFA